LLAGGFFYQRLVTAQQVQPAECARQRLQWPDLRLPPEAWIALLAAAALIVWFGSGSAPLGKSAERASAAARPSAPRPSAAPPRGGPRQPAIRTYGPVAVETT